MTIVALSLLRGRRSEAVPEISIEGRDERAVFAHDGAVGQTWTVVPTRVGIGSGHRRVGECDRGAS